MSAGIRRLRRLLSLEKPTLSTDAQTDPDARFRAVSVPSVCSPGLSGTDEATKS